MTLSESGTFTTCTKPSDHGCNYATVLQLATPVGPIAVERGYVAVDARVAGKAYRFVNTHLEVKYSDPPEAALVQVAQAAELLQVLHASTLANRALLVVGDINSSPVDPIILGYPTPYMQFLAAGYVDTWTLRRLPMAGFTCCQLADLSNRRSVLSERIDMLFSRDVPARVDHAQVVGDSPLAKTPPFWRGLWPSDHGAVVAELEFR